MYSARENQYGPGSNAILCQWLVVAPCRCHSLRTRGSLCFPSPSHIPSARESMCATSSTTYQLRSPWTNYGRQWKKERAPPSQECRRRRRQLMIMRAVCSPFLVDRLNPTVVAGFYCLPLQCMIHTPEKRILRQRVRLLWPPRQAWRESRIAATRQHRSSREWSMLDRCDLLNIATMNLVHARRRHATNTHLGHHVNPV